MSEDREILKEKAEENAKILEGKIEELRKRDVVSGKATYKEFWEAAREVSSLFKELKPLMNSDREELWEIYNDLCIDIKNLQQLEFESKRKSSGKLAMLILEKLEQVNKIIDAATDIDSLHKADDALAVALLWMKGDWYNMTKEDKEGLPSELMIRLVQEDNEECWEKWKQTKDKSKLKRETIADNNYNKLKIEADKALKMAMEAEPSAAKARVKELQAEMKGVGMSGQQFGEIKELLKKAWDIITEKQEQKRKEYLGSLDGRVGSMLELIEKNNEVIQRLKQQILDCEVMKKDATSYEFAMKVEGWIEEKEEKINDIIATNKKIKEKIEAMKGEK